MRKKRKESYSQKLRRNNWFQWKASQLRSSWRLRAKKLEVSLDEIPTRIQIQEWLQLSIPFKCYLTDNPIIKSKIEVDHKLPTSRGGSFNLDNLGITDRATNKAKGNMSEGEFRSLLNLIKAWEDKGEGILRKLRQSSNIYRRKF